MSKNGSGSRNAGRLARGYALASIALLAGCQSEKPSVDPGFTSTDSAGVTIVLSSRPQFDEAGAIQFDTIVGPGIGADESVPESHYRFLNGATMLSNGNIVLAMDEDVRMFGPDGKFIKTVARRGSGPGEFQSVETLLRLPNDTILVAQAMVEGGRKIALFTADGAFIREERPDAQAFGKLGPWHECVSRVFPNRAWLGCKSDSTIPVTASNRPSVRLANGMSSPGPGLLRQLNRWHLISPKADTSYPLGIYGGIEQYGVSGGGNGGKMFIVHPYYSRSMMNAGGNPYRIATVTNPQYEIQLWTETGKLDRIIRRANGRAAPTAAEIDTARSLMRQRESRFLRGDAAAIDAMLSEVPVPDSLPAISNVLISDDGHIAVARFGTALSDSVRYDIFTPDGRWLREFALPKRTRILEIGSRHMLIVSYNDDDVPSVKAYRMSLLSEPPVSDKPKP